MTQDKGNFVVLEHCPEKILLDSGKFKYRTKLLIKSELTGYKHWIMQAGLTRADLRMVDCDTFHVGNSRSFHVNQNARNATKYHVGSIIHNGDGVEFEILDRRYNKTKFGNVHPWILVCSLETGYTRWRNTKKICLQRLSDAKTKSAAITKIPFGCNLQKDVPKKVLDLWRGMMKRCYGHKQPNEPQATNEPFVADSWLNPIRFYQDIQELGGYGDWLKNEEEYHLDKDILVKGNREYSKDTCQFVPARTNIMYTANMNGYTIESVKTGARYPSMAACARQNKVAYCTVQKHVNGKVKSPKWVRV